MLPGSTNILDQLLGGFDANSIGTGAAKGVSAETNGSSPLFAELLAMAVPVDGMGEAKAANPLNKLFPSLDQPSAQDLAAAGQTALNSAPAAALSPASLIETAIVQPEPSGVSGEIADGLPKTDLKGIAASDQERSLPILSAGSRYLQSLLNGSTETPQDGQYQILDYQIADNALELTVLAEGQSEPARISLPVELVQAKLEAALNSTTDPSAAEVKRANNVGTVKSEVTLDSLLAKLNLKSLKIETKPQTVSEVKPDKADSQVKVELTAEQSGQQVVVKSRLGLQQVQLSSTKASDRPTSEKTTIGSPSLSASSAKAETVQAVSPIDRTIRQQSLGLSDKSAGLEHVAKDVTKNIETTKWDTDFLAASTSHNRAAGSSQIDPSRTAQPVVKLTLPDQIQKPFAVNGQSLMLKIEPEQLGPARLHLHLHDNTLTARVTVDTPLARTAVEKSLDQLTDQLSKVGIDVDRIEVNLSDNQAQQQFLDRRPAWTYKQSRPKFDPNELLSSETVEPTGLNQVYNRQYVGAEGVNLLA